MLLRDCILTADRVVTAPLERTSPEEVWVRGHELGIIPKPLFELYHRASYLSFGASPAFLRDSKSVLFSYFGLVLRSVQESLQEADDQLRAFEASQNQTYDPGKKIRGESWDAGADARARRSFRDLLIALQTSLDALADVVAIFLPGLIQGLSVGRAQFSRIEAWLKRPLPTSAELVISPSDFYLRKLHGELTPIVQAVHPETDWLPFMRLLRNKSAHLGQPLFRQVGLHDRMGHFYVFIPRQWPYMWERHIEDKGTEDSSRQPLSSLLEEGLIHQDIISFAKGLRAKVTEVIRAGTSVIAAAYEQFKDLPFNQAALSELEKNSEAYGFDHFL